ncbi:N-methyltryptophan oxidase [Virgibacillus phasianinus]|uniref:N-methyltryptophan oxidase n=1 Tax=Virgibacillus phasianinus TaxID=2017483 RepID=A0A220U364_9BACI|nr:N-methyl-L-tryptophan oxidase [Virgibacillus phasianinus]ASK62422.1 N-methyltryptophan oxidase [Virgibacillus phasianinus]
MDADVAVIGVGAMGSMALWQLAKRGVSVLGFEQFGIGNDRSAVGGESRLFRTAYMEGKEYVPLLQEARQLWKQLEEESHKSLLTLNGGLMIGDPNTEVIQNVLRSIEEFHLEHEVMQGNEAKHRYPQHRLFSDDIMVLDKNAGFLRPELATVAAANQAEAHGAKIHRYTKVEDILPDNDGVTILANGEKYRVGKVLITTGAWTGKLVPELNKKIKARRLVLTWFAPKNIEDFKPDKFPIFARMRKDFRLTGAPTLDGTMVKASNTKNPGIVPEPEELNRDVSLREMIEVGESVKELIPGLIPNPVRASVYMDGYTDDDHSIVGEVPGMENTLLVSGFSGHGFKMAPIIGSIAADLIIDGKTLHEIGHLDSRRFVRN